MACYSDHCGEYSVAPMLVAPYATKCCEEEPMCYTYLPRCPKTPEIMYCCEKKRPKSPRPTPVYCERHDNCYERRHRCHHSPPRCRENSPQRFSERPEPPSRKSSYHRHCPTCCQPICSKPCSEPVCCKPVKTKYVMPCYRYEDGRIVRQLPVTAFKRNGMQDQEHSKMLGTANFLKRCPRDVVLECDMCAHEVNQPTIMTRRACEVALGLRKKPFVMSTYRADQNSEERRYHSEDERVSYI